MIDRHAFWLAQLASRDAAVTQLALVGVLLVVLPVLMWSIAPRGTRWFTPRLAASVGLVFTGIGYATLLTISLLQLVVAASGRG